MFTAYNFNEILIGEADRTLTLSLEAKLSVEKGTGETHAIVRIK
jgi:hypothetical protein